MYANCLRKLSSTCCIVGLRGEMMKITKVESDDGSHLHFLWAPTSPTNYGIFMHLVPSLYPCCHVVVHQSHVSMRDSISHPIRHDNLSSTFRCLMITNSHAGIRATPLISGQLVQGPSANGQPGVTASTCQSDSVGKHKVASRNTITSQSFPWTAWQSNQPFCNTELRELGELRNVLFCFQSLFSTSSTCRR